jgi:hypothetical protein
MTMETIMKYLGMVMAVLYLIIGIVVLQNDSRLFRLPESYSLIFGIVLILYGLFRGYRIYQRYYRKEA